MSRAAEPDPLASQERRMWECVGDGRRTHRHGVDELLLQQCMDEASADDTRAEHKHARIDERAHAHLARKAHRTTNRADQKRKRAGGTERDWV